MGPIIETSLIITTFNWPCALERVLSSVAGQTVLAKQIVIADDGSSPEVKRVVERWTSKLPIIYVWQPDSGFRAARVRNLAALRSESDHLIFIDGDCLIPPSFIRCHQKLAFSGRLVAGGRYLLGKAESHALLSERLFVADELFSHCKFWTLPLGCLRDLGAHSWETVRTCNLGMMRQDFLAVGGFDESYVGWGREDSDLVIRLLNNGMRIRSARFGACVLHLFHSESERHQFYENDIRFGDLLKSKDIVDPLKSCTERQ